MDYTKLIKLYPNANKEVLKHLSLIDKENWSTTNKLHFLAQCAHESAGFRCLRENLNYSEQSLARVFGKYFRELCIKDYARKPDAIADVVYANRMGNGDVNSHDGSRYKGRGLIQLTGRNNYTKFGHEKDPEYLETPEGAVKSAIWFWIVNGLHQYNQFADLKTITKKVNGGFNGLEDRTANYNKIAKLLLDWLRS